MIIFFFIFIILGLVLNFDISNNLSTINNSTLMIEGIMVAVVGILIINRMLHKQSPNIRNKFIFLFLLSYGISLIYMHFSWVPYMQKNYGIMAFDPIRYYYGANEMTRYGSTTAGMNYFGVVYFYAFFMKILGINPLVPLFVNELLALYAVLGITNFFKPVSKGNVIKYMPFLLIIPEIICYNAFSSREIICMTCFTIFLINAFKMLKVFNGINLAICALSLFFLLFVRPPYGFIAILCVIIYAVTLSKDKKRVIIMGLLFAGVLVLSIQQTSKIGDTSDALNEQFDTSDAVIQSDSGNYSQNSVSLMLLPSNSFEFVVFGIIRSFAYVVISPSNIMDPYNSFFNLNGISPTDIYCSWTSLLMMICFPLFYKGIKGFNKTNNQYKIMMLSLLICFFVVGTFMASFIHIRYRIIYDLLYFSIALYILSEKKYIYKK
jgi:hypothetical protein